MKEESDETDSTIGALQDRALELQAQLLLHVAVTLFICCHVIAFIEHEFLFHPNSATVSQVTILTFRIEPTTATVCVQLDCLVETT
jgi:hypothetical protein